MTKSDRLQEIMSNYNLELLDILQSNERKKVYIYLVSDTSNQKLVLKYCASSENVLLSKFKKENKFYREKQAWFIPDLILSGNDFLCIPYISGMTLLDYLSENKISESEAENYVMQLININKFFKGEDGSPNGDIQDFTNSFMNYLSKLFNSGPWGRKRSFSEDFFFEFCWYFLKRPLSKKIFNYLKKNGSEFKKSFVHNDFHQNNILRDNKNKLHLIDYENYGLGYSSIDLIYCLSTLFATGRVNTKVIKKAIATDNGENSKLLQELLNVYLCAVQVNRKFCKGSFPNVVINFLKLCAFLFFGKKL